MTETWMPGDQRYGAVVRSLEGVRNRQAVLVLAPGFLLVGMLTGLGNLLAAASGMIAAALLLDLLAMALAAWILNAAGLALMDAARGLPARRFGALLRAGARCLLALVGAALLALGALLAFVLAAALVLWICKLPWLGPPLLALLLPVLVLAAALLLLALFVALSMVAPSLWAGNPLRAALRQMRAVVSRRPLEVIVSLILLALLSTVVAWVAGAFLLSGSALVGALAATIFGAGTSGGMTDLAAAGPATLTAGGVGLMLLFLLLSGLLTAIQMNGLCHIYLQSQIGADAVPPAQAGGSSASPVGEAGATAESRGTAADGDRQGPAAEAEAATDSTLPAAPADTDPWADLPSGAQAGQYGADAWAGLEPTAIVPTDACPVCKAPVAATDRFCGECGQRLLNAETSDPGH